MFQLLSNLFGWHFVFGYWPNRHCSCRCCHCHRHWSPVNDVLFEYMQIFDVHSFGLFVLFFSSTFISNKLWKIICLVVARYERMDCTTHNFRAKNDHSTNKCKYVSDQVTNLHTFGAFQTIVRKKKLDEISWRMHYNVCVGLIFFPDLRCCCSDNLGWYTSVAFFSCAHFSSFSFMIIV